MSRIISTMQKAPYKNNVAPWRGAAIDIDMAFASVLESMQVHVIYVFSDNMTEEGDVHLGDFSTRNFVKWLRDNDLGSFQTTGPLTSNRTQRMIQGWFFMPSQVLLKNMIETQRTALYNKIKELNSDSDVKDISTTEGRTEAIRAEAFAESITTGW